MASRGGAVAAAAGQARKRADSFRSTGSMEVGDSGEIDHSGPTMNPRRVLPNAKGRDKLQKSLKEHGKYTQREIRAIEKMQYRFRCRRTNRRLYKKNLIERLEYERRFTFGFLGLFNQTAIFFLLIASLYLGGQEDMQRGIYFALNEAFDFDAIKTVSSRDEFMTEMMPHIATTSKKYFVLSSQYFDTKDKGALELLKPVTHFAVPRLLNGVQVNLNLPSFSWTCWVKMSSFSRSGAHVVRKRIETEGSSQEQWCWALSLDKINGPTFQYAAHDHFDTSIDILKAEYSPPTGITLKAKRKQIGSTSSAKARKIVDGTYTSHTSHTTHGWDDFRFLTMTANRTHASFFMDAQLLETIRLPRVITDCYSAEGLRIGDAGLHLAKLIFYPSELTPEQIAEIHHGGSTLVDFASGSDPADAEIAPTTFSKNVFDATDYPKQLRLNAAGPAQALFLSRPLYLVTLYSKYTWALTLENLSAGSTEAPIPHGEKPPCSARRHARKPCHASGFERRFVLHYARAGASTPHEAGFECWRGATHARRRAHVYQLGHDSDHVVSPRGLRPRRLVRGVSLVGAGDGGR
jgi:hypothetical protein